MLRIYRRFIYKLWRLADNLQFVVFKHGQRVGAIRRW